MTLLRVYTDRNRYVGLFKKIPDHPVTGDAIAFSEQVLIEIE